MDEELKKGIKKIKEAREERERKINLMYKADITKLK